MLKKRLFKRATAVFVIMSCIFFNAGIIAEANTVSDSEISNKLLPAFNMSSATDTTAVTTSEEMTDELMAEINDFINNVSALTDDDIISQLNGILNKLEQKTPDKRNIYAYELSKAFIVGLGEIASYKANVSNYMLPSPELMDKMTQITTLIDGYKSRVEELGYTAVSNVLENDCKAITIDFENSSLAEYSINFDSMSLKMLIIKGFGIKVKINNDYVLISSKNIEYITNTYVKDSSTVYVLEFEHRLNYNYAGDFSAPSTHISNYYFDISTFGYHFAAKSHYIELDPKDVYNRVKKEIPSYTEPIYFYIDYSKYANQIDKSRLFSFDFSQYFVDGSVLFDGAYKLYKTNEIYISTKSTGYHALGLFKRTFEDIRTHWAKESIEVLASRLIVNGKSFYYFEPESKITRAEYSTLLTRILGLPASGYKNSFSDVGSDDWYANSIQAASDFGLIKGEGGYFRPNDNITREEMTTILMRAYKLVYSEIVQGNTDNFEDSSNISSWALESVGGAVERGFILGVTPTTFMPKTNATRAEAATILLRFISYLEAVN